jgi:Icc-related predicted phosphoesterase
MDGRQRLRYIAPHLASARYAVIHSYAARRPAIPCTGKPRTVSVTQVFMKLLGFSDLHGDTRLMSAAFAASGPVDCVVLSGDITNFGGRHDARLIIDELFAHCRHVYAVHGNCDGFDVAACLEDYGCSVHGRCTTHGGIGFIGAGFSLPCPGTTPGEISDADFHDVLSRAAAGAHRTTPLVLVTHEPPFNTAIDLAYTGEHVGSRSIRRFIERRQPLLAFAGHIHEARGIDTIGATIVCNPGPLRRGWYTYAEINNGSASAEIRCCADRR